MEVMIAMFLALLLSGSEPKVGVVYSTPEPGTELKLDFYAPAKPIREPVPLVVVIHGGAWMTGKREDMTPFCLELTKRGLAAATVQYRLAPKFKWPAMLDDVQTAVRFLRKNAQEYGIDANRIAAMGASAGGHLALFLGATDTRDTNPKEFKGISSRVSAVFNVFGPVDMLNDFPPTLDGLYMLVIGKKREEAEDEIRRASPLYAIDGTMVPVFTVHGDKDALVPVRQASRLDEKLKQVKREHTMRIVPNMGHEVPTADPERMKPFYEGLDWLVKQLSR
jgi:acetyl esterase/lipase